MSKKHELKILKPFADAISRGEKTFEVRKNDRNIEAGDIVEFTVLSTETLNPEAHPINGRQYKVGYVLRFEDFPQACKRASRFSRSHRCRRNGTKLKTNTANTTSARFVMLA